MSGCLRLWGTQRLNGKIYGGSMATLLIAPNPQDTKIFLEEIFNKFYDQETGEPLREIYCLIIGYPNYVYIFDPGVDKEVKIHQLLFGMFPVPNVAKTTLESTIKDQKWYVILTDKLNAIQKQCLNIKDAQNPLDIGI